MANNSHIHTHFIGDPFTFSLLIYPYNSSDICVAMCVEIRKEKRINKIN